LHPSIICHRITRSTFGRYRAGPAILADGHIGENALGDRAICSSPVPRPTQLSTFTVIEVVPTLMISA